MEMGWALDSFVQKHVILDVDLSEMKINYYVPLDISAFQIHLFWIENSRRWKIEKLLVGDRWWTERAIRDAVSTCVQIKRINFLRIPTTRFSFVWNKVEMDNFRVTLHVRIRSEKASVYVMVRGDRNSLTCPKVCLCKGTERCVLEQ